ncbi:MAG: SUMF1/EgtB/PvdO family nonheme iron enzyme, partial [Planctomycetota bacterium]
MTTSPTSIVNEKDGSEMILIPAGDCIIGEERKVVPVESFYIDKFPISNGQYKKFMDATGAKEPLY